jgi:phosphohistidine phosphatase
MKTLFLLRHARAENSASGLSDLTRVLNERGREEAQTVGTFIKKQNLEFDLVLSSPAVRARNTTDLVLAAAGLSHSVRDDERIYEAGPLRLLEVISEIEQDASATLLVGHNPGIEELLILLTGSAQQMATATLARIDFRADEWSKVAESTASLEWIVTPNEISQNST